MMVELEATDEQLLESFVTGRDPGAFRSLVSRHGPAVLGVCRTVLHDRHEAEDAFQAAFLVLIRKAGSIAEPDKLGAWLRGVAYRTATRARCRAARRRVVEASRSERSSAWTDPAPAQSTEELRRLVGEELDRLPDAYRQPVTLCYLQGLTHEDAARRLGWPLGTVKVRLVRARRLLGERLQRRGVKCEAGVVLILLVPRGAPATPGSLVESTVEAMKLAAAGRRAPLEVKFARALEIAESVAAARIGLKLAWQWAMFAAAVLLLAATGPAVLAFHPPLAPEVGAASLPSNLTDILAVECR